MLPYATVQEAETALGRFLTTAETIWFNYSAAKSDYFLYCHNILFLFVIFSAVLRYYIFLEIFFVNSIKSYKIQPKVKLSVSDVFRCYKSVMRMFFLAVGPLQLVSYPSIKCRFGPCVCSAVVLQPSIVACSVRYVWDDFPWTPTRYIPFYGGPDYHDYLHYVGGQSQSNFASVFTYCDYLYGNDKGYRYQKKVLQQLLAGPKSNGEQTGVLHNVSAQDVKVD